MPEVTIKWLEARRFVGVDSTQHGIVISGSDQGDSIGVKPADLMLLALGSCTAYDVVNILEKKRQKLTGLDIRVSGTQLPDPPWTFTACHIQYVFKGRELTTKAVEDAISLSDEKYCSVAATLRLGIPVTHDYEIIEDE